MIFVNGTPVEKHTLAAVLLGVSKQHLDVVIRRNVLRDRLFYIKGVEINLPPLRDRGAKVSTYEYHQMNGHQQREILDYLWGVCKYMGGREDIHRVLAGGSYQVGEHSFRKQRILTLVDVPGAVRHIEFYLVKGIQSRSHYDGAFKINNKEYTDFKSLPMPASSLRSAILSNHSKDDTFQCKGFPVRVSDLNRRVIAQQEGGPITPELYEALWGLAKIKLTYPEVVDFCTKNPPEMVTYQVSVPGKRDPVELYGLKNPAYYLTVLLS